MDGDSIWSHTRSSAAAISPSITRAKWSVDRRQGFHSDVSRTDPLISNVGNKSYQSRFGNPFEPSLALWLPLATSHQLCGKTILYQSSYQSQKTS
jgi:hypothetical protein